MASANRRTLIDMDRLPRFRPAGALLVGAILLAANAHAHPYDSPLEFRAHKTRDGRIIYSNIPMKCFKDGVLKCYRLHPIFPSPPAAEPTPAPEND